MADNWYDEQKQQHFSSASEKRQKKTVAFSTLLVCMLITGLLGGGLGSIIALGGQARTKDAAEITIAADAPVDEEDTPPSAIVKETLPQIPQDTPTVALAVASASYSKVEIVEKTAPSIVGIDIEAQSRMSASRGESVVSGSGSGIIVSQDGYIITNNHVIENAVKIMVYLYDDTEYEAKLVATDARTDLAVIKIEANGLTPVVMGDSDAIMVGEDVVAIGNPLGEFRGSATSGMISALARNIEIEGRNMTLIQTDAAINPGNSGGGLFNMKGELIGVINAKIASSSVEGLGFAIPVNSAKEVVADLMDLGYVSGRAYLGVYMELIEIEGEPRNNYSIEDYFGFFSGNRLGYETRVRVTQIVPGSAAQNAGIQVADIILAVGDKQVKTTFELSNAIGEYKAGDVETIKIQRDGQQMDVSVTFGELIPE